MEEETLEDTNSGTRYLKKKEPEKESQFEVKKKAFPMKRDQ